MDSEVPSGDVSTGQVVVVIAVDDSSQAEYAFDCKCCLYIHVGVQVEYAFNFVLVVYRYPRGKCI